MKTRTHSKSGIFNPRILAAFVLGSVGVLLAMISFAAAPASSMPLAPTGSAWSIVTSPNTSATQSNELSRVTCSSASDCWAVGSSSGTLIEHWNGTAWSIVTSPNTGAFSGVTCASAPDCWAVGDYFKGNFQQTLIEHWNGTVWSIVTSPNTSATQSNELSRVTCTSASDCWAVGSYNTGGVDQTLIEHWNGTVWSIVTSPNTSATQDNLLFDVTCSSASDCWAVGYDTVFIFHTLIEHWNGTVWSIVTSPNATRTNLLYGVTCTSTSDCWAVGYDIPDIPGVLGQTLIERWNGTAWSIVTSPNASTTNRLFGVTCTSASNCWAVGEYEYSYFHTLTEHWNGTAWSIVNSANASTTPQFNRLLGVTCASASNCWAVGTYFTGSILKGPVNHTLIERYPSIVPSVVSRKLHDGVPFDIKLPLFGPLLGVECRKGDAAKNFEVIATFPTAVTVARASVIPDPLASGATASVNRFSVNGSKVTVDLTNVSNAQTVLVNLFNVSDGTKTNNVKIPMGVLLGDSKNNGVVDSADVDFVTNRVGQALDATNFRADVTIDGMIDSKDVNVVESKKGTSLP